MAMGIHWLEAPGSSGAIWTVGRSRPLLASALATPIIAIASVGVPGQVSVDCTFVPVAVAGKPMKPKIDQNYAQQGCLLPASPPDEHPVVKAVILAGGLGTRLSEETQMKPKPMIEVGGRPILWHIMKTYSAHGVHEFVICCGYRGYLIKEYFANYFLHMSDVSFDIAQNKMEVHHQNAEPWRVTLVDTGEHTMTGGRLRRVAEYVAQDDAFCFTYGDGVADVDIAALIAFHRRHGKRATVTAVQPPGRYGALDVQGTLVTGFLEKPQGDHAWINGGFFVLAPECLSYISDDRTSWEEECLPRLARDQQLMAFHHRGFWQPMDTLRDKNRLEALWQSGVAPWKSWR